jgi:arsenate reductase-like glutaredoxin family protein
MKGCGSKKKMMKGGKAKAYEAGGVVAKPKPITQKNIDRMMMEGEQEYRSTLSSRDAKARADKMKKPAMKKEAKKMAGGGMCRGYGAATRGMNTSSKMG